VADHPDLAGITASDSSEGLSCYSSWSSYIAGFHKESNLETKFQAQTVSAVTNVYETIESFAKNETYTGCDGIPRLRFLETPTQSKTRSVTVTEWFNKAKNSVRFKSGSTPKCKTILPGHLCRKLQAMEEIGGELFNPIGRESRPRYLNSVCPIWYSCDLDVPEVVLLYWPDNIQERDICGSAGRGSSLTQAWAQDVMDKRQSTFITDKISFRGQDLYFRRFEGAMTSLVNALTVGTGTAPRTGVDIREYFTPSVLTGDFTFTSPTVYLAHRPIRRVLKATPLWEGWPGIYQQQLLRFKTAGVIPIHSTDVSTIRPARGPHTVEGLEYAKMVAQGSFIPTLNATQRYAPESVVPLNFGDLLDPVPASAYYDARHGDCWGKQSHCGTITDDSFRPKLRINPEVWISLLGGRSCSNPMVVDPPIALTPLRVSSLDTPGVPFPVPYAAVQATGLNSILKPDSSNFGPGGIHDTPVPTAYLPQPGQQTEDPKPGQTADLSLPIETQSPSVNRLLHPILDSIARGKRPPKFQPPNIYIGASSRLKTSQMWTKFFHLIFASVWGAFLI
jgi:hypothetical protein